MTDDRRSPAWPSRPSSREPLVAWGRRALVLGAMESSPTRFLLVTPEQRLPVSRQAPWEGCWRLNASGSGASAPKPVKREPPSARLRTLTPKEVSPACAEKGNAHTSCKAQLPLSQSWSRHPNMCAAASFTAGSEHKAWEDTWVCVFSFLAEMPWPLTEAAEFPPWPLMAWAMPWLRFRILSDKVRGCENLVI